MADFSHRHHGHGGRPRPRCGDLLLTCSYWPTNFSMEWRKAHERARGLNHPNWMTNRSIHRARVALKLLAQLEVNEHG